MDGEIKTVEVPEPVTTEEVQRPSVDAAKEAGWSAAEIESAKKRNMLVEEPETPEAKAKKESEEKVKAEATAKANEKPEEKRAAPRANGLPDFTLTPEQEEGFNKLFPPGSTPRGLYHRMKNERLQRQVIEAKAKELEDRLKALESKPVEKKVVLDEEGNEIDPDDKPLTLKQLRELQKQEAEEITKKQSEQQERAQRVTEAQEFQEEYAKSVIKEQGLPDYDDTVNKAKDVMQNLDALVPEKWKQARVISLWRDLQSKAANADKIGVEDDNAAFIAYEIGKFHPEYGKPAEKLPDGHQTIPKASGGLTPEQMKKVEQNTQRRPSSAAIPSGNGRRSVVPEDVSREDINRMNYEERSKFKRNHPEQYRKAVYENA